MKNRFLQLMTVLLCIVSMRVIKSERPPLYTGEFSENFVIRWAFQAFCDYVYDARTGNWPTGPGIVTFDPSIIKAGDVILVRDTKRFYKELHHLIKYPYIIITLGDASESMKDAQLELLDDPNIIAWFGVHPAVLPHKKYYPIPLGIVQEKFHYKDRAILNETFKNLRKTTEKKYLLYLNFEDPHRPHRTPIRNIFIDKPYCKVSTYIPFQKYLEETAQSKFVLSPSGVGPDCYRNWEALLVGSIPIVKKSQIDPLLEGLPVLIVDKWEDITEDFLNQKYEEITSKQYDIKRLYMEYWLEKINAVRNEFLAKHTSDTAG